MLEVERTEFAQFGDKVDWVVFWTLLVRITNIPRHLENQLISEFPGEEEDQLFI